MSLMVELAIGRVLATDHPSRAGWVLHLELANAWITNLWIFDGWTLDLGLDYQSRAHHQLNRRSGTHQQLHYCFGHFHCASNVLDILPSQELRVLFCVLHKSIQHVRAILSVTVWRQHVSAILSITVWLLKIFVTFLCCSLF